LTPLDGADNEDVLLANKFIEFDLIVSLTAYLEVLEAIE